MVSRRLRVAALLSTSILTLNILIGSTVTGIKSLNNSTKESDYKTDIEYLERIGEKLNNTSDFKEYFNYTQETDTSGFEKEIAYLIQNNIITREGTITIDKNKVKYTKGDIALNAKMSESDFLMGLYKSKWGVLDSRPLVIETSPTRIIKGRDVTVVQSDEYTPKGYTGNDNIFEFDKDYYVYISPNVNELYIAELLNKGIIPRSRLEGLNYLREFDNIGVRSPAWYSETPVGIYNPNGENPLGNSWTISKDGDKVTMKKKDSIIFTTETMTKIDALRYVESILKLTERDMTASEANIVAYKYGVNYLNGLPEDDVNTIKYLIAMGILNFEDKSEVTNLYDNLTTAFAYDLFYRVNNTAGRYNFSQIQLTDNDNFWLERGYGESIVNIVELKTKSFNDVLDTKIRELTELSEIDPVLYALEEREAASPFKKMANTKTVNKNDAKVFEIIRYFPKSTSFTYRGVKISDLEGKSSGDPENFEKCTFNSTTNKYEVTFKVSSVDETTALLLLDSNTQYSGADIKNQSKVKAVTKVTAEGSTTSMTLISASSLSTISSDLQVLEDKVLLNKASGALAVLLPDNNLALVGTKVIKSEDVMVFAANGEKYYNLEVIASLLTNGFISSLDDQSIYITRDNSGSLFNDTNFVDVYSSNDTKIDLTNLVTLKDVTLTDGSSQDITYYNVTLMQRGINTITVEAYGCTFIIDWSYIVPEGNQGIFADVNANPSIKDMTEFFYKKPGAPLDKWWNSNIELGNAIANWVYGTSGVKYITCGYLSPSINVLANDSVSGQTAVNKMLEALELSSNYLVTYTGVNNKSKIIGTEFNALGAVADNMYDDLKASRKLTILTKTTGAINGLSNGVCYSNFLKLANGSIYRSVNADGRVLLDNRDGKTALFVKTRTADQSQLILWKNVNFKGETFNARGVSGGEEGSDKYPKGMYYKLLSTNAVSGTIKEVGSGKYELQNKVIEKGIESLKSLFGENMPESFFWNPTEITDMYEAPAISGFVKKSGYYLNKGNVYYFTVKDGAVKSYNKLSPSEVKSEVIHKNKTVYTYPVVWVHRNMIYYDTDTGQLMIGKINPYLNSANLFYAGLNRAVIDSIIANAVSTKPANNLKEGDVLIVGDMKFKKENNVFKSYPITDNTVLQGMLSSDDLQSAAAKAFTGITLDYSGRNIGLIDFITSANLGQLPKGVPGEKTLTLVNGIKTVKDGSSESNLTSATSATSVALNVEFNNKVLCRSLDGDSTYVLVHSTNSLSDGYLSNAPFFGESLHLGLRDDLFTNLNKSKFNPLPNFLGSMEAFVKDVTKLRNQDIKTVIRNLLIMFCWWFIIMSWLVYAVLRYGLGYVMLEAFRNPNRISNRDGFDLVKIMSFGIYNLDMAYSPDNPQSVKLMNFLAGSVFAMLMSYILYRFF